MTNWLSERAKFFYAYRQFVRERKYLKNVTPKTINYYNNSWDSFCRLIQVEDAKQVSRALLNDYVVKLRESGIKPVSCNTYISGINAFLGWLFENRHIAERLTIKKLKVEQQVVKTIEEDTVKAILSFKPQTLGEYRIHAILCLLLDTGIRIEEALTQPESIDLNNLILKVMGKGQKERLVPFS